uniref:HET domain-containing protein n=1 Tax=Anisakis simplex TaxID=6269 RepID=A0A0M3J7Y0_ANISI
LNKPERLFAAWFYAMWILKMDVDGQFPEVVAKPSVSNPAATYDARLQSAEQIRNCVIEVRLYSVQ